MKRPMLLLLLTIVINIFLCINFHLFFIILFNLLCCFVIFWSPLSNQYLSIFILAMVLSFIIINDLSYEPIAYTNNEVSLTGYVSRYKMEKSDQVLLKNVDIIGLERPLKLKKNVLLNYNGDINTLIGTRVKLNADLKIPETARNPNGFNQKNYLLSKNTGYIAQANEKTISLIKTPRFNFSKYRLYIEEQFNKYLYKTYDSNVSAFLKGFILGDKSDIDKETLNKFYSVGLGHILVVSGLHFGILYLILKYVLNLLRLSAFHKSLLISLILLIFLCFIGIPISALRAYIFIITYEFIYIINRRVDLLNYLSFIAILMLIFEPFIMYSLSFQLSFGALLSIGLFYNRLKNKLPSFIALILSVQCIIAFLNVHYFNYFNFSGFIINIPIHFTIGVLYFLILINFVLWPFRIITLIIEIIIIGITKLVLFFSSLDFLEVTWPSFTSFEILMIILFFTCIIINSEKRIIRMKHLFIGGLIIGISMHTYWLFNNTLEISFYDVGNADGSLITTPQGGNILIDSGAKSRYDSMDSILLKDGIKEIEYLILTHNHNDHIGGTLELLDHYTISHLFLSRYSEANDEIKMILSKLPATTKIHYLTSGDTFSINGVLFKVLNPMNRHMSENNQSIVLDVSYLDYKVLFTGDIEEEGEKNIMEHMSGSYSLLKVPHHGSETSSTLDFIRQVKPKYGIIQVGSNTYGHPSKKVLNNFLINDTMIFRNDHHGCIKVKFNEKINISTMKAK